MLLLRLFGFAVDFWDRVLIPLYQSQKNVVLGVTKMVKRPHYATGMPAEPVATPLPPVICRFVW